MRRRITMLAVGGALAVVLTACGQQAQGGSTMAPPADAAAEVNPPGDIPDDQAFVAYTPPAGGFSVDVPEGWARSEAGGAAVFTDKLNSIRIESAERPAAPTPDSAIADEVPAVQRDAANFTLVDASVVTRTAGDGVLVRYTADGPADPVTGKVVLDAYERYEFWRGGTQVTLTLSGPQGADNVDPWRIVTDSLGWH